PAEGDPGRETGPDEPRDDREGEARAEPKVEAKAAECPGWRKRRRQRKLDRCRGRFGKECVLPQFHALSHPEARRPQMPGRTVGGGPRSASPARGFRAALEARPDARQ